MSKILYIDGIRLHRALVAGIQRVISREDHLNKINVFPVPDCDTGTNLAFTFEAILSGTKSQVHSNLGQMLSVVAESALDGARGNAGVLFAQYLRGLSESGSKLDKMDTRQFSEVIQTGVEYAYGAFLEPREGTILTVITDFSNQLKHSVKEGLDDFQELIR
ncbi:MAG: DAK2 domain-containing protein, partial [FCB group bacterium]|nr:DAK2 domain-containing protein [FCB group bacterium]